MNQRAIAMKCSQEQFDKISKSIPSGRIKFIMDFSNSPYLVNFWNGNRDIISNLSNSNKDGFGREVFEEWDEDVFLEYCGIIATGTNPTNPPQKLTITGEQLLSILKIACNDWKGKICEKYIPRIEPNGLVTFTQKEIDEMFKAASPFQSPLLIEIFGERKKEIDYSKIKTGSIVKIKESDRLCNGK